MELTKEYFDRALKAAVAPLATQKDLEEQTVALARMVADTIAAPFTKRFDLLETKLDVTQRVQALEKQMSELRDSFHLN